MGDTGDNNPARKDMNTKFELQKKLGLCRNAQPVSLPGGHPARCGSAPSPDTERCATEADLLAHSWLSRFPDENDARKWRVVAEQYRREALHGQD